MFLDLEFQFRYRKICSGIDDQGPSGFDSNKDSQPSLAIQPWCSLLPSQWGCSGAALVSPLPYSQSVMGGAFRFALAPPFLSACCSSRSAQFLCPVARLYVCPLPARSRCSRARVRRCTRRCARACAVCCALKILREFSPPPRGEMISVRGALVGGLGFCGSRGAREGQSVGRRWFGCRLVTVCLAQGVSSSGAGAVGLFSAVGWRACELRCLPLCLSPLSFIPLVFCLDAARAFSSFAPMQRGLSMVPMVMNGQYPKE